MFNNANEPYKDCTICGNHVIHSPEASTANNLGDSEVLERIREFNYGDIDDTKIPSFAVCTSCREGINNATKCFKRCQELMTVQQSANPKELKDSTTQTNSPKVIIIVNKIPKKFEKYHLKRVLEKYGKIVYFYFKKGDDIDDFDNFARIRYSNEHETLKVMEAAQRKELKYYNYHESLIVTRVSDDSSPIDVLPDTCLSEIFLRIDEVDDKINIGKVCKRWKRVLSYSWSNIKDLDDSFEEHNSRPIDELRSILKGCGRFLKSLHLSISNSPNSRVELISELCKNIENLHIEVNCSELMEKFQDEMLSVFQQRTQIRRLCIQYIDDTFNCNHLEYLSEEILEIHLLHNDEEIIPCRINLSKFQRLEALSLCNFDILEDSLKGFENLENLEYVSFSGSCVHRSVIHKILNFEKLKHLAVPDCGVDDVLFAQIIRRNLVLEHLDISDNRGITDLSFQYVARLSKLKTLWMKNLSEVTGSALTQIHTLEQLDIEGCISINDWILTMMIDKSPELHMVYAAGVATWRSLVNAGESIEMNVTRPDLDFFIDTNLAVRWMRYSKYDDDDEYRLNVSDHTRPSKMDAEDWSGWHGDVEM